MKVSMIAAMALNRVIGTGKGGIPWSLPRDKAHFRAYTQNHHMLLGRATYEEMKGWFTTQTPLVLTRNRNYFPEQGVAVNSVEEAIEITSKTGESELVVSGGASVYKAALPFADVLILTIVETEIEGDVRFPDYSDGGWEEYHREAFGADGENRYPLTFIRLRRR